MNYLRRGRPRRDQWASPHQRAQTLAAERLDIALAPADADWLDHHLAACRPCAGVAAEYVTQSNALRELGAWQPEPPRDLWARTAAVIEQEAARGDASSSSRRAGRRRPIPVGILSGALVVAVVVGASLLARGAPITPPDVTPVPSGTPGPSVAPAATPLAISAGDVAWLRQREDGSYGLYLVRIDQVCPGHERAGCAPIDDTELRSLPNLENPSSVVLSPSTDQLVLVDAAADGGGTIYVVPVPPPLDPSATALPTPPPTPSPTPPPTPSLTPPPTETPGPTGTSGPTESPDVTLSPEPTAPPTPSPSPAPSPEGATAIATGVTLVGDSAAYSPDGQWFAFSALPADGSHGPDVYVWHVGDAEARPVTGDHRSVFAAWFGGRLLGSRVVDPAAPSAAGHGGPPGRGSPSPLAPTSSAPPTSPSSSPTVGANLTSETFLIDPASGVETVYAEVALWRPSVGPSARYAVYWEGTLESNEAGTAWWPAAGRLVVGPWPIPLPADTAEPSPSVPAPSPSATASPLPTATATPTPAPTPRAGPASTPRGTDGRVQVIEGGRVRDWDARWDPSGSRLALWIADPADPTIGRLSLYVVDPETGRFDPSARLLRDQPALAGFSLGNGLLAWATPPGQDGEGSRVQVLAWSGDAVGSAETTPGSDPVVIIR